MFYLSLTLSAQVKLPSFFSDNMVLQKGIEIPVWGTGNPGDTIKALLHNQVVTTVVGDDKTWKIKFSTEDYGGPYELKIISGDTTVLKNIMIGEVWLCSGQSNMEMPLGGWGMVKNYKEEIANANYGSIRLLFIPPTLASSPQKDVKSEGWKECTPENAEEFSAVAYFFGRDLYNKLKVQIGLIDVTKGGTPIESWMSKETLKDFPEFDEKANFVASSNKAVFDSVNRAYKLAYSNWMKELDAKDPGFGKGNEWFNEIDLSRWKEMKIPGAWENAGLPGYDGVVWFKKEINLPDGWLNQNLTLSIGQVQDNDIAYFNGTKIGEQKKRDVLSIFTVNKNLVTKNKCDITVRIFDAYGPGGMWGKPDMVYIQNEKGEKISLAGEWYYKPAFDLHKESFISPENPRLDKYPSILFNGMISPLTGYGVKGILWYQGESNAERAYQYRSLFALLIKSWRDYWHDDSLPFYIVQLANYKEKKEKPKDNSWAELREAQSLALNLNNTGMAVTIDIGDAVNIHYKNKQEAGRRLALIALNKNYGFKEEYSGPVFNHYEVEGNKIRIYFDHADGLKTSDGNAPAGFAVCGKNKKFYWADAEIDGSSVIVWSKKVKEPSAVRFEWATNPDCNLYNAAGLPAAPFRTDDFRLITEGKK